MSDYRAPVADMLFVLREIVGIEGLAQLPGYGDVSLDLVEAVLKEAAKFAGDVLAPLNATGDREGARWHDGKVVTPNGFTQAYRQFIEGGWNGVEFPAEIGGQGLPKAVGAAVREMWAAANLGFSLILPLNEGAIHAIMVAGSPEQKERFLPRLVSGEWTGTMNLTEPQAGSDLSAVRTRAEPQGDGSYRLFGQKIFITYGDHDLAENIVHLVLARTPSAPAGTKGLSLFLVPKFLIGDDGRPGAANDVRCVSIEHKLGIHASPTCVIAFGDHGGARGFLVGEENRGLEYMFVMMNSARFATGLQGLALAERAYQKALAYARERTQGRDVEGGRDSVTIIHHADVRRMLMLMKSQIEAMRSLAYFVAAAYDRAERHPDPQTRARDQSLIDLLMPVIKGWLTETGVEVASLGVQVHGGMGYVEETGAAQFLRDVRITTIYEGTTGIQANDLIGRKVARDGGASVRSLLETMRGTERELAEADDPELSAVRVALGRGLDAVAQAVEHLVANYATQIKLVSVGAVPFLKLLGIVAGGWQLACGAIVAQRRRADPAADQAFFRAKVSTARFYADHVLAQAPGLAHTVIHGGPGALALADEQF